VVERSFVTIKRNVLTP